MSLLPPEGIGHVKTKYKLNLDDIPDTECLFISGSMAMEKRLGGVIGRRSIHDKLFRENI